MQTNIKFAIGAVLILGGLFAVWNSRRDSAASSTSAQTIAESNSQPKAATQRGEAALSLGDPSTERTTALPPASTVAPATAPAVPARSLRGRVLDATQRAQAGLRVRFSAGAREVSAREFNVPVPKVAADAPAMITDASGAFELPMPMREGELVVEDAHWTTVLSSLCGPGSSESEHVIIVAPHLEHAGYVLDDAGQALAKVRIEIHLPRDFRSAFSRVLDHSAERGWVVESDERGRFEFSDAPRVEGALLSASLDGYASLSQPAPDASDRRMELVLHQPQAKHGMVAGQVIDDRGAPAAGARVSLGHCKPVISDRGGSFTIAIPEAGPREQWIAVKDGHQPAIEGASAAVKNGSAEAAEFVLLRLGPPPLSISGRVVDDEGKPQSGFKVFIADPTFFGAFDEIPMHLEGMLSGAATRSDLEQLMAKAPEGSDPEAVLKETSSVMWTFVRTDSDGNFRLGGLLDRTYRVAVLDPETLLRVDSESIPAGTADALLRLPKSAYLENLRGRVVTRAGKPVAGVRLAPNIDVLTVHIDEHSWSTLNVDAGSVLTDAEGRFVFERLPREHVYLEVTGEDILPLDWARKQAGGIEAAAGDKKDQIVIQVDLRYHFQVEVAADLADELRVVDSRGLGVMINGFEGNSRMSTDVMPLVEGRSKVMVVGEEARTLVLFKEKQEVARIQLSLVLGQLNVVRM